MSAARIGGDTMIKILRIPPARAHDGEALDPRASRLQGSRRKSAGNAPQAATKRFPGRKKAWEENAR